MRAVKVPSLDGGKIGPSMESCVNCDGPISMAPCSHQGNIYVKRKLQVWRDQKCIPLVGAITSLYCAGHHSTTSRGRQYRAQNGKFWEIATDLWPWYRVCTKEIFIPKEATGMERPEMYSVSRCNNLTYLCGQSKYPVSRKEG